MRTDIASAAGGNTAVVGVAAAPSATAIAEPIPCRSPAAAASVSGAVITNDIARPPD
nr:hypothetical protein [Mycobacterium malmoense]